MQTADFLVIGAGIAGSSAAFALAEHGSVLLLERESQPGYHSTGRSAALFFESYGNQRVQCLTRASAPFLWQPPAGFAEHPILTPRGVLTIARADQLALLEAAARAAGAFAEAPTELDGKAAERLLPVLRPGHVAGALFQKGPQDMDVHELHRGFLRGMAARGGRLVCDAEVRRLERQAGQWQAETAAGPIAAPVLVNAAGAWADEIARLARVPPIGLQPMRRTAFTFDGPAGLDNRSLPMGIDVAEAFYFKPEAGRFLGSLAEETPVAPGDAQPEELDLAVAVDRIEQATIFEIRRLTHRWAGLRSFVADRSLVIGPTRHAEGFHWLAAQGGYGIQTSPAAGRALAALATGRELPADIRAFGLSEADLSPDRPALAAAA